jgi:hypothetical protein
VALKEAITQIKDGLNEEDSFLKSIITLEKFYKKNKIVIIVLFSAIVLFSLFYGVSNIYNNIVTEKTNIAYNKLILNGGNKEALEELQSNKPLYEAYVFLKAIESQNIAELKKISSNDSAILSKIAKFEVAIKTGDANMVLKYANGSDIMKDYALFQAAFMFANDAKYKEAKSALLQISNNSKLKNFSDKLEHFLITKAK